MATTYRVTFLISSTKWGWGETWWRTADSLDDLAIPISKYLAFRKRFMGYLHHFEGVRVSVEGASRNGAPYLASGPIRPGGPTIVIPNVGDTSEASPTGPGTIWWSMARAAMQVYTMKAGRRLGTRYFAPFPVLIQGGDQLSIRYDQVPEFWDRWNQFYTYFTGSDPNSPVVVTPSPAGWLVKTVTNLDPTKEKEIISWRLSAGADTDLTFELAPGDALNDFTTKNRVVIRKAKMRFSGLKSPNGTWRVSSIVPPAGGVGQLVTIRFSSTIDVNNISAYGLVRIRAFTYVAPDDLRIVRIGPHKRGRPFGSTAGRLSTRQFAP